MDQILQFEQQIIASGLLEKAHVSTERFLKFSSLLEKYHNIIVDPEHRQNASIKAELIKKDAETIPHIRVELLPREDPDLHLTTYNVVVTLGDPQTGPSAISMVHFDTVKKTVAERQLIMDIRDGKPVLRGRTIQDDTIHLAAVMAALPELHIPENGSQIICFTDHEENGCLGSKGIKDILINRLNQTYPVAFLAFESTDGKLVTAHNGKYSSQLICTSNQSDNLDLLYQAFNRRLRFVQKTISNPENQKEGNLFATGSSTYGVCTFEENKPSLTAILDFRTNQDTPPETIRQLWEQTDSPYRDNGEVIKHVQQLLHQQVVSITTSDKAIQIEMIGQIPRHPSNFKYDNDRTVHPVLFTILKCLTDQERKNICNIIWGDQNSANSLPLTASIIFKDLSISKDVVINRIISLSTADFTETQNLHINIQPHKTTMTPCVQTDRDIVVYQVAADLSQDLGQPVKLGNVPFMTDIGRIFNDAKTRGLKTYGYVYGVGNPDNLHDDEFISIDDVVKIVATVPLLMQSIHISITQPALVPSL